MIKAKNPHWGSSLDEFLDEEGTREAFQAVAVTEAEKLHYLRKAWQEGLDSGDAGELDFEALKQEAHLASTRRPSAQRLLRQRGSR
jgi:hypothetical protein